jgi:hypothetical protein
VAAQFLLKAGGGGAGWEAWRSAATRPTLGRCLEDLELASVPMMAFDGRAM